VGDWPLNVLDDEQAAAELPTLRAIAAAEIHNLVFATWRDTASFRPFRMDAHRRFDTDRSS
jgi:hypothetical protein